MNLKEFHLVLISLSILLAIGFGVWALKSYVTESSGVNLLLGLLSLLIGVALIFYIFWYVREIKKIR